ncbi:MAG: exosome nuclease subunit [Peltula sp. TS41687]|nr:MAG: exosome nuclease subunit [Peltula sp. TS41687]
MDASQEFGGLQSRISSSLVEVTRTVGQLSVEDLSFQRSLNPSLGESLDKLSARLLRCGQTLVQRAVTGSDVDPPQLDEQDDLENYWGEVVEVVDLLLERADTALDEYTGLIKRLSPENREQTPVPKATKPRPAKSMRNLDLPKPQLQFVRRPNNQETSPFKPLLKNKPHAIQPLESSLVTVKNEDGIVQYKHPYEAEIIRYSYPQSVSVRSEPIKYKPFETTTATFVDTLEGVRSMLAELKAATEIAIDLEHHDTRSYVGLVCLMQISTREKDWIIDTLKPWREELQILNEVFTDPRILKVFHGAYMDIVWLQRDLGLYVVGLFDTYHAARALGYPQASLASLLSRFVKFDADKQYQMADWRMRPLPTAMFDYARSDTHFLLYIYDNLRNQLIDKAGHSSGEESPLFVVQESSKETALQTYERYIYDEAQGLGAAGWYNMLRKTPALFSTEQFAVFRALHQWRDRVARADDDNPNYIMPKQALLAVARTMPLDIPALLSVSHPISSSVRSKARELLTVIKEAKTAGVDGPDMATVFRSFPDQNDTAEHPGGRIIKGSVAIAERSLEIRGARGGEALISPMRSALSTFWGSTFGSSIWDQSQVPDPVVGGLRLALPLPPLTAEIFQDARNGASLPQERSPAGPGARAEHPFVRDRQDQNNVDDGIFIIKQLGGARKRKVTEQDEDSVNNTGISPHEDVDIAVQGEPGDMREKAVNANETVQQKMREKAERKAERKRLKRQEEGDHTQGISQEKDLSGQTSFQPFDYVNAESVLHAKGGEPDPAGIRRGFDPYSKAANAPSGARKTRRERPGKTLTFKK